MHLDSVTQATNFNHARLAAGRAVFRYLSMAALSILIGWAPAGLAKSVRDNSRQETEVEVRSPDGRLRVDFILEQGTPYYRVTWSNQPVINRSKLGLRFKKAKPLDRGLTIAEVQRGSVDTTWTLPWGEVENVRDHHNELRVTLRETGKAPRKMVIVFRVFDDGLGFRYELPRQDGLGSFELIDEETEFALTADHPAWWIPAYQKQRYEYLYTHSPISAAGKTARAVHTPLTLDAGDLYLSIHEAALTDYASMTLVPEKHNVLRCDLVPWSDGVKVRGETPLRSPWRTIQVAQTPGGLIESHLILNLNEPSRIEDTRWIHPGKYVGIWWGMHLGKYTWGSGDKHGATTANAKQYIGFAADHGFSGVLIEGWNKGWDGDWIANGGRFDFTTPYEDFDLPAVSAYARKKGVKIIGHNETGGAVANYERQMEDAFRLYRKLGIDTVKTGYVAFGQGIKRYDESGKPAGMEWHHGQYMVRHYRKVVETAARYGIMLDVHEPIKDTGIRRTYPNMMTREGARGQEYNAWGEMGGNPPQHTTVLPFTRMLAGPFDFTPGIFDLFFEEYHPDNRINTTLAKQLALYVVLYSPLQMAADLPESYDHPAFRFIEDVPTDWKATRVLNGRIGEYVTIARQDRHSDDWYIGSITNEEGRVFDLDLKFLDAGRHYVAEIYADGKDANWKTKPLSIDIFSRPVTRNSKLTVNLAPGGGQAIRLRPAVP